MLENVKKATEYAFSDNVADMTSEIETAIQLKIHDALAEKRVEVARSFMNPVTESEEPVDDFEEEEEVTEALIGKQKKLDKNKNGKLDAHDFKLLRKESYIEEKLSVSDGVDAWIKDFVHSDDSKFDGKSKKERIQMALGAFYAAKKGNN